MAKFSKRLPDNYAARLLHMAQKRGWENPASAVANLQVVSISTRGVDEPEPDPVASNTVDSLNALTGDLTIDAGTGIDVTTATPKITIKNTGVWSVEGCSEAIDLTSVDKSVTITPDVDKGTIDLAAKGSGGSTHNIFSTTHEDTLESDIGEEVSYDIMRRINTEWTLLHSTGEENKVLSVSDDAIVDYSQVALSDTALVGFKSMVAGILPIANGGTGLKETGAAGKVLAVKTKDTELEWVDQSGSSLPAGTDGDILYYDSDDADWVVLPIGTVTQVLTVTALVVKPGDPERWHPQWINRYEPTIPGTNNSHTYHFEEDTDAGRFVSAPAVIAGDGSLSISDSFDMPRDISIQLRNREVDTFEGYITITGLGVNGDTIAEKMYYSMVNNAVELKTSNNCWFNISKIEITKTAGNYNNLYVLLAGTGTKTSIPNYPTELIWAKKYLAVSGFTFNADYSTVNLNVITAGDIWTFFVK